MRSVSPDFLPGAVAATGVTDAVRQDWNAARYRREAGYVSDLGQDVLEWLAPQAGEDILDLGCGDGALSVRIAARGARVTGVDASADMVDACRAKGLDARCCDARALTFEACFDAVFSNAALHWIKPPQAVIDGVGRALKPGGRFVGEFGGFGNIAAIQTALMAVLEKHGLDGRAVNPWYFPTPTAYRGLLEAAGFEVRRIELIPRPTLLPQGLAAWLDLFAQAFLAPAGAAAERVKTEVVRLLQPVLCDEAGVWTADHVRLRFAAFKS